MVQRHFNRHDGCDLPIREDRCRSRRFVSMDNYSRIFGDMLHFREDFEVQEDIRYKEGGRGGHRPCYRGNLQNGEGL